MEWVLLPVIAYDVCLTTTINSENIIARTVIDLAKCYSVSIQDKGKVLDLITERTKLNRVLVKAILKRYQNSEEIDSDQENEGLEQKFYRMLYDPITKQFLPRFVPVDDDYQKNTSFEEIVPRVIDTKQDVPSISFKFSMSDSRWFTASVLNYEIRDSDIPLKPVDECPYSILHKYLRNPKDKLVYLGSSETVGIVCALYLSQQDLSKIHVMNPVGKGSVDYLMKSIKEGIQAFPDRNEELGNCIQVMESNRKRHLEITRTFKDASNDSKYELLSRFPEINQYTDVWEYMAKLEANFNSFENTLESGATDYLDSIKKEFATAFYNALEKIFSFSIHKNFPQNKVREIDNLVVPLNSMRGTEQAAYFAEIAKKIGIENAEDFFRNPGRPIQISQVQSILIAALSGETVLESLLELVVAHIVQASVDEDHPFRKTVHLCPQLLRIVKQYPEIRNVAKHNNYALSALGKLGLQEITEMKNLAETMLDLLLVPCVSWELQKKNAADIINQQNARIKATERLGDYPSLNEHYEAEVHENAERVCFCFAYQDPEYFSACSNLLSALTDVTLREFSVHAQRVNAAKCFCGDKNTDDRMMHALFENYRCDYSSSDRPQTKKISKLLRSVSKMTLKCKFYLCAVALDQNHPRLLGKIFSQAPELPKLIDYVCIERAHNKMTDFSAVPDGYEIFHKQILNTCETWLDVLKGGE